MINTNRRNFLRGTGVILGLPFLESLAPAVSPPEPNRRLVAINVGLGLHAPNIIPTKSGHNYETTPYLKPIADLRHQFTMISGVANPEVGGGHRSDKSFLTGARHPASAGFRNTISVDQLAAAELGSATRFASLTLSNGGPGLSWSRSGVGIPALMRPSRVFKRLFVTGKPDEQARAMQRLQDGRSVLDTVMDKTKRMERRLSGRDKAKLDQYFEAVREAERRLAKAEVWQKRPMPTPKAKPPRDETDGRKIIERQRLMYDVMHLAIETDSTRFITLSLPGLGHVPTIRGVDIDYHNLSHHGKDPEKIKQLTIIETAVINEFARFIKKLNGSVEYAHTLLDATMVMFGSNLGNASSHSDKNLPIVFAGGGFKHGQHLAFDRQNNYPLTNLYVSMLQRLGIETDSFSTGTSPMRGLDLV